MRNCDTPPPPAPEDAAPEAPKYSDNWSGSGRFADEEALPLSFWLLGPRPRRGVLISFGIWGLIAPATNLWGTGSFLLSLFPQAARDKRLDTFYPISTKPLYPYSKGYLSYDNVAAFKRYYDEAGRFEFRYPASYVLDQAVFLRNQQAAYDERMLDPTLAATPASRPRSLKSQQGVAVALGPPRGTGDENLSVVIGSLEPGFTLRGTLGSPEEAAQRLLDTTIAKQAVVKSVELLGAGARVSARSGRELYEFLYSVEYTSATQPRSYTVCVVGSKANKLYTFASRVPEAVWLERADELREAAASFALL